MRWPAFALLCLALLSPAAACAQGPVDAGVTAYENGDFEAARAAFGAAEASDSLSRADLVRLLATRALLAFAEGSSEAMLRDLTALVSLEPAYDLGPRAPPVVQEALERARAGGGALRLAVEGERTEGGASVRARIEGDRAGLIRRLELAARGEGDWVESEAGAVSLPGRSLTTIEYHAAVVGPGGALLVEEGSAAVPQQIVLPPLEEPGSDDSGVAIGLGVGAGVLAAAAVVLVVVLLAGDGGERVDAPRVEWP